MSYKSSVPAGIETINICKTLMAKLKKKLFADRKLGII